MHQKLTKENFKCIRNAMDEAAPKKLTNILVPKKYKNVKDAYNAIKNDREEISEWDIITDKKKVVYYVVE